MSAPPAYANYGHSSSATPSNVPFSNPQSKIELKIACRYLFYYNYVYIYIFCNSNIHFI